MTTSSRRARRANERKAEKAKTPGNAPGQRTPLDVPGDLARAFPDLARLVAELERVVDEHEKRLVELETRAGLRVPTEAVVPTEPVVGVPYCDVAPNATTTTEEAPDAAR